MSIFTGTAGWTIPRAEAAHFAGAGSHLERYARIFPGCEINSTFYRPPLVSTLERWRDSVPAHFRFALKLPKVISHERRLVGCESALHEFLALTARLAHARGPLLLQLPPSFAWDARTASDFFTMLRAEYAGALALEARHATWFTREVEERLSAWDIARVAADPPRIPEAATPAGSHSLAYFRWHGSPRMYYSAYDCEVLDLFAAQVARTATAETWCIFDNTAHGHGITNARVFCERTRESPTRSEPARHRASEQR